MFAIVIGASGAIANAVISRFLKQFDEGRVLAVSRQKPSEDVLSQEFGARVAWQICDYSEISIQQFVSDLTERKIEPTHIFITNGLLHTEEIEPEKRLLDVSRTSLLSVIEVNAAIPLLWVKHLLPLLKKNCGCIVTLLSARIGSITDNQLGGWYSYRMSKAALNMGVKTAAIEYGRIAPGVKFLLYHPGTTDTPLSKPFQRNVPDGKLFSPSFTAEKLFTVLGHLPDKGNLFFRDWRGDDVDW